VLPVDEETIRLFLHVLGACVWVGGQIVLVALLPVLRPLGPDAVRKAARQFQRVAWPAFGLLVVTGIWNIYAVDLDTASDQYLATFSLKMIFVVLSGACAAGHSAAGWWLRQRQEESGRTTKLGGLRAAVGILGAAGLLFALGATFTGLQLHG
jgi:putative copper export protein